MSRTWTRFALAVTALACGPIEPWGTPGALRAGGFLFCDRSTQGCDRPVPDAVAVRGEFSVEFSEHAELDSSDPRKLEKVDGYSDLYEEFDEGYAYARFRAVAPGTVEVEARVSGDAGLAEAGTEEGPVAGELVDYLPLRVAEIDRLTLHPCERAFNAIETPDSGAYAPVECHGTDASASEPASVSIVRGDSLAPTVCVRVLDRDDNDLGGYLGIAWDVSPDSEAQLQVHVNSGRRCATIGGLTLGAATVTAHFDGRSVSLAATVLP